MRKFCFYFILFLAQIAFAGNKEELVYYPDLHNDSIFNYEFDLSKVQIDGRDLISFVATHSDYMATDPDVAYKNFSKRLEISYIFSANDKSMKRHGYLIDNSVETRFLLHIYIDTIDDDGEHTLYCDIIDRHNDNKKVVTIRTHSELDSNIHRTLTPFFKKLERSGEKFGDRLIEIVENSSIKRP